MGRSASTEKDNRLEAWLTNNLVCPRDHKSFEFLGNALVCGDGHRYPVLDGIPVMLLDDVKQTAWWVDESIKKAKSDYQINSSEFNDLIDPHVQYIVDSTCGHLYKRLRNRLNRYPIPLLRMPKSNGQLLLDIGCNWGRWTIAAARKGYKAIGIDPSLDAIIAARRIAKQLNIRVTFVVADARYLPFRPDLFDAVFSYSVLQHFSKENVSVSLSEVRRVLRTDGRSMIQMPNIFGIRCLYHQAKRRFRAARNFEVRYWNLPELKKTFETHIGTTGLSVDGYFGLGIQPSDVDIMPWKYRLVIHCSEFLRKLNKIAPWMKFFADSVYVTSIKG